MKAVAKTAGATAVSEPAGSVSSPVLKTAIQRLRAMALEADEGEFLGSEDELRARLGVSRPTYRQAVRMLEQDQLLTKRMGAHGGCYASRPDAESAARAAALYLKLERATLHNLLETTHNLQQNVLQAACRCTDDAARANLAALIDKLEAEGFSADVARFLEREREYESCVLAMTGNPMLTLFIRIARKFVDENPTSHVLIADPAMRKMRSQARVRMARAILAGDKDACLAVSTKQNAAYLKLISDDALHGTAFDII